jgi:hypothetical protein
LPPRGIEARNAEKSHRLILGVMSVHIGARECCLAPRAINRLVDRSVTVDGDISIKYVPDHSTSHEWPAIVDLHGNLMQGDDVGSTRHGLADAPQIARRIR